jgi:hypothetical protein
MLQIENVLDLPQGQDFYLRQDDRSDLWIYTVKDGVAKLYKAPVVNGDWSTLVPVEQTFHTFEKDVTGLIGNEMGDTSVIIYKHNNSMSILKMPADTNRYVYDDTYRLYWAVDSRKLYMNIAKNWEMIGTLRHELLDNVGTLTHDEIETKLTQIEQALNSIGTSVSSLNGMAGDITIEAGSNIMLTKDAENKKLTIAATGGGGTGGDLVLPINTTLPTEASDGYTCLVATGDTVIQAARVNGKWYQTPLQALASNKIILPDTFMTWTTTASGVSTVQAITNGTYTTAYKIPGNSVNSASVYTEGTIVGNKAGQATFYIGSDSEASYDKLTVILNGTTIGTVSGAGQIAKVYGNLIVGNNTIRFQYTKDGSGNTGADCGYVYAIDMPWTY